MELQTAVPSGRVEAKESQTKTLEPFDCGAAPSDDAPQLSPRLQGSVNAGPTAAASNDGGERNTHWPAATTNYSIHQESMGPLQP